MSQRALNGDQFGFLFHPSTHREMGGKPYHTVEVWEHERIGSEYAQMHPGERLRDPRSADAAQAPAASLSWHHKTGEILGLYTNPEHQRKGVATAMLGEARRVAGETHGVTSPKHSAQRTQSGEAWARSTGDRLPRRQQ